MCLLIAMKPQASPTREQLETAAKSNPDGFGYAIACGNRIVTAKGMNSKDIIDRFMADRAKYPDGHAIFHHRYATGGVETKYNCHPFRVGGSTQTYLAHNGILPLPWDSKEPRSDTHVFAADILPAMGIKMLDSLSGTTAIEKFIGTDKIAVLNVSKQLKCELYLLNEKNGHWVDDVWFSNYGYQKFSYRYTTAVWDDADDDMGYWEGTHGHIYVPKPKTLQVVQEEETRKFWLDKLVCKLCGAIVADDDLINEVACPYCNCCMVCGEDDSQFCPCNFDGTKGDNDLYSKAVAELNP